MPLGVRYWQWMLDTQFSVNSLPQNQHGRISEHKMVHSQRKYVHGIASSLYRCVLTSVLCCLIQTMVNLEGTWHDEPLTGSGTSWSKNTLCKQTGLCLPWVSKSPFLERSGARTSCVRQVLSPDATKAMTPSHFLNVKETQVIWHSKPSFFQLVCIFASASCTWLLYTPPLHMSFSCFANLIPHLSSNVYITNLQRQENAFGLLFFYFFL